MSDQPKPMRYVFEQHSNVLDHLRFNETTGEVCSEDNEVLGTYHRGFSEWLDETDLDTYVYIEPKDFDASEKIFDLVELHQSW